MSFSQEVNPSFSKKDFIEIVDIEGCALEVCHHLKAFERRALVKCAQTIILNDKGELLLEFRKPDRHFFPSHWNASSSGFIDVGESARHAAEREIMEELGIEVEVQFIDKFIINEANDHAIDYFFIARHNGPFECNEAECVRFFKPEELHSLKITPHLREQLRILEKQGLPGLCAEIVAESKSSQQAFKNPGF